MCAISRMVACKLPLDPAPTESSTLAGSAVMQGQVSAFFMMDPLASAVSTRIRLTVAREIYLKS